ncbi:MAG: POTRA domain-containing protein [Candidatus Cloacimonadales bacterium]|nr:POTRA domain-containing protein [Candidatus Cloacimonadales bacterium]
MSSRRLLLLFFAFMSSCCFAQLIIGEISFEGNYLISDVQLQKTIISRTGNPFNQEVLNQDANRISDLYKKRGFWNIKVQYPQLITNSPTEIDVIFQIEEEKNLLISQIELNGNRYISSEKIKQDIQTENIDLPNLNFVMQNILEYYADNGFLFAAVSLDSLVFSEAVLYAYLNVQEGNFCEFGEFRFRGNTVTKAATILKISQLRKAEYYTPEILEQAADNLRKKTYIKKCDIIPLNSKQLLFDIEEDRMSLISGIVGFDNSQTKSRRFTGFLNVEFLNLYGTDRSLSLTWQRTSSAQSSIALGYHESGLDRFPVSADISLSREEVDSTYIKTNFKTEIYWYDLTSRYGVYWEMENIYPGSRRPKIVENTAFQKLGVFWNFSGLDFYRNPTKGNEYSVKYYTIFSKADETGVSKQAVELKWYKFLKLRNRVVLAALFNLNLIENKKLTEFETFDLGGNKNLRGFVENQFSGYQVSWTNLELRYLLNRNSRIYVFADHGYVKNLENKFGKLFGFGVGIKIETRLGMLGIDYAFSYQDNELRNPLDGIIHFGLESKL